VARGPGARYPKRVPLDSSDIVALAQDAEGAEAFERGLLALFARTVGFDAAFVESKVGGHAPSLVGLDAKRMRATPARRARYDRELAEVKRVALASRGVAVDTAVLGMSAVRTRAYHRDVAAPVGGKHSLLAFAFVRGREVGGIMLGRAGAAFREGEVAIVESALPAIGLALASFESHPPSSSHARASSAVARSDDRLGLTPRELDVLDYLCLGYTNVEIARACGSSPNTVRNQLVRVFAKLGASTRSEAVALALRGRGGT
jgi:DNA-binding CsgD family transcriptional regulator